MNKWKTEFIPNKSIDNGIDIKTNYYYENDMIEALKENIEVPILYIASKVNNEDEDDLLVNKCAQTYSFSEVIRLRDYLNNLLSYIKDMI